MRLNLSAATVSHHLKKLAAAGLVSRKKEQYYVVFEAIGAPLAVTVRKLVEEASQSPKAEQARVGR